MQRIPLTAHPRQETGKGPNRRLRVEKKIPGILYGLGDPNQMIAIEEHDFQVATAKLGDEMVMYEISLEGNRNLAVIREAQRDPVTERIEHLDFLRVDLNEPITVDVAIHSKGTSPGVKEGGVMEQGLRYLSVRCKPDDVPAWIEVDVTGLNVNDSLHVSDLQLGEAVEILSDEGDLIFSIISAAKLEAAAAAADAAAEAALAEEAEEGAVGEAPAAEAAEEGEGGEDEDTE